MRLLIVQYGDYREAEEARARGEPETYRAQHHSLQAVERLAAGGPRLVVCLDAGPYDWTRGGLRVVAGRFEPHARGLVHRWRAARAARAILGLARDFAPTHALVRAPGWVLVRVGGGLLAQGVPVLPVLADFLRTDTWAERRRARPQAAVLNDPRILVCANHNYPACRSLVRAGVRPDKVVPYDWPPQRRPEDLPPRTRAAGPLRLLYAGAVSADKGVSDLLEAVRLLREEGLAASLELYGGGPELESLRGRARELGLAGEVADFRGRAPNAQVLERMRQVDLVVVPSRPSYPEGLPNVIYEALEMRTPAVLSDHPSFTGRLTDGAGVRFFRAGQAADLAAKVRAAAEPAAFADLSRDTVRAWRAIQCPVTFADLVEDWAGAVREGRAPRCLEHGLAAGEAGR